MAQVTAFIHTHPVAGPIWSYQLEAPVTGWNPDWEPTTNVALPLPRNLLSGGLG